MTSPPLPPNRRRRRIVVITIAVLVLGLGWWFWPRVDQRFVGKWAVRYFSVGKGVESEFVELFSSGRGIRVSVPTFHDDETRTVETFYWRVTGNRFDRANSAILMSPLGALYESSKAPLWDTAGIDLGPNQLWTTYVVKASPQEFMLDGWPELIANRDSMEGSPAEYFRRLEDWPAQYHNTKRDLEWEKEIAEKQGWGGFDDDK